MRKSAFTIAFFALFFVGLAAPAVAQDTPAADAFLGYSLVRTEGANFHGANGSLGFNFNDWFAIVGDISGHSNSSPFDTRLIVYTFGPQLSYRRSGKIVPFSHFLFGGAHASASGVSDSGFAMNLGGGLDWNATDRIGVRLIQADALVTRFSGNSSTDARLSFGVVFHIGGRR